MAILKALLAVCISCVASANQRDSTAAATPRPNVVFIITDDQGYGDLGIHGNPFVRTPHLDALARESVRLVQYYASPVCAPTRASLLTGRYNFRTGVIDTYLGRAMMFPDEVTLAEMLSPAGYRTGIFGKWHLGDCYPMRPIDQGFHKALVHRGGGIGQPSDPPGGESYFDPILQHNGRSERFAGYCSNIFTDAAIEFIEKNRGQPFFVYLAFNAPHAPLEVADADLAAYRGATFDPAEFSKNGRPAPMLNDKLRDATARVYAMVSNIDANVGRLLSLLDRHRLAENTIVIFTTDNGPAHPRYTSGLRGQKGTVYEGGIRVPFFVRWPGRLTGGREIDRIAAHIDVVPTLLEAAGVAAPGGLALDGRSLVPLLEGKNTSWPDRTLFFQWHRGDEAELYRAFAARSQRFKLVQSAGVAPGKMPTEPVFELFDIAADPFETQDVAKRFPQFAARLKSDYEAWFRDVTSARQFALPRIIVGSPHENPAALTRQDWRGPNAGWKPDDIGYWDVQIENEGPYDIDVRLTRPTAVGERVEVSLRRPQSNGPALATFSVTPDIGSVTVEFRDVKLPTGPGRIEAFIAQGAKRAGAHQICLSRRMK